jgi:hypothetical protein
MRRSGTVPGRGLFALVMRAALLVAALALNTCSTAKVLSSDKEMAPVEMQTIAQGAYGADQPERKAVLATSEAEYRKLWESLIGEGDAPSVDFEKSVAVFLLAGMRNTGGWSVKPESARVEADGTAVITAKVQGPPPGGITTQAITYPYAVVAIRSRDVTKVTW